MKKEKIERHNILLKSGAPITKRVCISIPLTGLVRVEWMLARYGQITPVNWSVAEFTQFVDTFSPFSFAVDHARNLAVDFVIKQGFEWLIFIDHDVIIPPDFYIKMNNYMRDGSYPLVCGWYNAKGNPPEPLLFRGRGNSWYSKWKPGDKVWVDGIPMGCTLISVKLLKSVYDSSEQYSLPSGEKVRKVFFTPREAVFNKETGTFAVGGGTEDLWFCDRVLNEGHLKKTGFTKVASKKFPILVDTSIKCGHIDNDGRIF